MQAVESQNLILYHTDLRGEWPELPARSLAARLRYGKRLATLSGSLQARASLAGIALALRALSELTHRSVAAGEIVFSPGEKPRLAGADPADEGSVGCPDFSIAHSGEWVGCAAVGCGRVGFDVEIGSGARIADWVVREAALKACGAGVRGLPELRLREGGAEWRGEPLFAHALELFPGAAACVMTSLPAPELAARAVPLAQLFAL